MNTRIWFLLLLITVGSTTSIFYVHGANPVIANSFQIGPLKTNIPARVDLTFSPTQNATAHVSSLAISVYAVTIEQGRVEFSTTAIDSFTVEISVAYLANITQTVSLAVFSQSELVSTVNVPVVNTKSFVADILVNTSTAVSYPTTEQILEGVQNRFNGQFDTYRSELQLWRDESRVNLTYVWMIAITAIGIALLCLVGVIWSAHNSGQTEARIARISARQEQHSYFIKEMQNRAGEEQPIVAE